MNDAYYTQTGERADLAALEVNAPEGYIADKILPIVPVREKTGVVYYATVTADVAAQTNRSVGAAPDGTQISDSNTTFTCAEAIKRGKVTPDEAKTMGGIEKADMVGARFAKRSVMKNFEQDVCALILQSGSDADAAFDPAKVRTQIQTAKQAMRLYEGRTALVAATYNIEAMLQAMLSDATYGAALARLVTGTSGVAAVQGISLEAWKQALAIFFGVQDVLAGDDTVWNATAVAGRFAIVKLDDSADELAHKYKPVLGKAFQFLPDGKNPWLIEAIADRITKNNYYDATQWYDAVVLNSGAAYVFDGVPQ
jgi:hypothetical protein